jgi:phosphoglycolate phosphatase
VTRRPVPGPHDVGLELVCLDLAGTTVADDGLVERAFDTALGHVGIGPGDPRRAQMDGVVRATMGSSKIEVFRALFGEEDRARAANSAFEEAYDELVRRGEVKPLPGAETTMGALRAAGLKVALTTGFSVRTRQLLIAALGWGGTGDLALSPEDAGRGRPYPDLVLTAVLRLEVTDVRAVAVAGDTAADMLSGRRAGASWVVGVETGADDRRRLLASGATHVVASVAALPALLGLSE